MKARETPRWPNPCRCCRFLCRYREWDYYYCMDHADRGIHSGEALVRSIDEHTSYCYTRNSWCVNTTTQTFSIAADGYAEHTIYAGYRQAVIHAARKGYICKVVASCILYPVPC